MDPAIALLFFQVVSHSLAGRIPSGPFTRPCRTSWRRWSPWAVLLRAAPRPTWRSCCRIYPSSCATSPRLGWSSRTSTRRCTASAPRKRSTLRSWWARWRASCANTAPGECKGADAWWSTAPYLLYSHTHSSDCSKLLLLVECLLVYNNKYNATQIKTVEKLNRYG